MQVMFGQQAQNKLHHQEWNKERITKQLKFELHKNDHGVENGGLYCFEQFHVHNLIKINQLDMIRHVLFCRHTQSVLHIFLLRKFSLCKWLIMTCAWRLCHVFIGIFGEDHMFYNRFNNNNNNDSEL